MRKASWSASQPIQPAEAFQAGQGVQEAFARLQQNSGQAVHGLRSFATAARNRNAREETAGYGVSRVFTTCNTSNWAIWR
jgi:hypothetical protein